MPVSDEHGARFYSDTKTIKDYNMVNQTSVLSMTIVGITFLLSQQKKRIVRTNGKLFNKENQTFYAPNNMTDNFS